MANRTPSRVIATNCTLPRGDVAELRKLAAENDRPLSRELARALREYLVNLGRVTDNSTAA